MSNLVTLSEAKDYIRVTTAGVDTQIQALLDGVEVWIENLLGCRFTVSRFIEHLTPLREVLQPWVYPVISISEIVDLWEDNEVIPATDYQLMGSDIFYKESGKPPSAWPDGLQRYRVTYLGGYSNGNTESNPAPEGSQAAPSGIKLGVLALLARAYTARGGIQSTGGGGSFTSYDDLANGEVMTYLDPFIRRRV